MEIENIFEKHVNWDELIRNDDNFKNILQVKIQKEFKVTPHYLELTEHDPETGYNMGVFICIGQEIHEVNIKNAISFKMLKSFEKMNNIIEKDGKIFVFLASSVHKIKKKAEQEACEKSIQLIG